ncbi:uncharacterized protein N7443_004493 [Penicillium atrosanguineum]|uniref:Pentatricopeptide repeat protein n=1 Tax=Penicillium atrosanguineum TaxID=1132637 RepID=A0A9W9Q6S9_9EURO|nr:uncharacterized protein N7443_004493 [Penicillium atrosanguineum]KAJ5133885.1 hypothetical protein N7526_005250 [Penicillium atrosanguineum]KAJ5304833.1 hypothetical protein N7443_004493 [Penicillium atrosanguineum]KAJ5324297.1 hypothetical protein N7476_002897 [Penicillium atrosanguineum]
MPQLNRSPSSPSLRDPPKQALELSTRPSMPRPKPLYHASVRRLSSRPRPSVASIADIFVGSLVLAGFCHDHSPRGRGISTTPLRPPENHLRRFRGKNLADRGQMPAGRRVEYSRTSVQASRPRSWLSTGLAQKPIDDAHEHNRANMPTRTRFGDYEDSSLSDLGEDALHRRFGKENLISDTMVESNQPTQLERGETNDTESLRISPKEERANQPPDEEPALSHDEKDHMETSQFFKKALGKKHNWEEAVYVVLPKPQAKRKEVNKRDGIESRSVARLVEALKFEKEAPMLELFNLYREIPSPGVAKLPKHWRGHLLRRFSKPPNRRWGDARRYLALVDDMNKADLPMSLSLWSSAISFAARGNGSGLVLRRDLVRAIGLWQNMEHVAGVEADGVVFSILIDCAIKSGQYTVAAGLEAQMRERGLEFDRYGAVAKIFSSGLQKNVEGITATFEQFVRSGHIVDTVALNCVCVSYLRAGEVNTAEQIYARMLEAQRAAKGSKPSAPDSNAQTEPALSSQFSIYRGSTRKMGRLLKKSHALKSKLPAYHRALQDSVPMTPDTRTFYIFLRYFSRHSGQLDMFMTVLRDMESTYTVPPRHLIYMLLFEGFGIHGKNKRSWSAERLRLIWSAYLRALRDSKSRLDDLYEGNQSADMVWENPLGSMIADLQPSLPTEDPNGLYVPLPLFGTQKYPGLIQGDDPGGFFASAQSDKVDSAPDAVKPNNPDKPIMTKESLSSNDEKAPEGPQEPHDTNGFFSSLWPDDMDLAPGLIPSKPNVINKSPSTKNEDYDENKYTDELDEAIAEGDTESAWIDRDRDYGVIRDHGVGFENGVFIGRRMVIAILRAFGTTCGPREVLEAWLQLEKIWRPHQRMANDVYAVKEELDKQMAKHSPHVK